MTIITNVQVVAFTPDFSSVLCTKRSNSEEISGGVIDFPGGTYESTDVSLEACAVREYLEEVGISLNEKELVYAMSTAFQPSEDTTVLNVVFGIVHPLALDEGFEPDGDEVEEIFLLPMDWSDGISVLPEWNQGYLQAARRALQD